MTYSVAEKILALYAVRTDIDYRNSIEAIRQTVSILASGGLNSAWVYTGSTRSYTNLNGMIALKPNLNKRIYALIYVDHMDEYNIDLVRVGEVAEFVAQNSGIFVDQLAAAYESIYDNYVSESQAGLITYRI